MSELLLIIKIYLFFITNFGKTNMMQVSKRIRTTTTFYEPAPLDEVEDDEMSEEECDTSDWESSSEESDQEEENSSDDDFIEPCHCGKNLDSDEDSE